MNSLFFSENKMDDLFDKINELVIWLKSHKIKPRELIALLFSNNMRFILMYQACKACSLVPVIIRNRTDLKELGMLGISFICTFEKKYRLIQIQNKLEISLSDDVSVICQTSGTTGSPKYIPWTFEGIDYQNKITYEAMQYQPNDILVTTLSLTSAYGLSLVHLWEKYPISLVLTNSYYPDEILKIANVLKISSIDNTPRIYSSLLKKIKKNNLANELSYIRLWCCGGDYLPDCLSQDWLETMKKPLLDGYGLAEAGPNVALNTPDCYRLSSVGKLLPEVKIKFSTNNELLIFSTSCAKFYWPNSNNSLLNNGWLATADICTLDEDGFLYVKGRVENKLVINGMTYFLEEIEYLLSEHLSLQIVATKIKTMYGDRLGLVLEKDSNIHLSIVKIRQICREYLSKNMVLKSIFWIDSFPLSKSGKLDRQKIEYIVNNNSGEILL